MNSMLRVRPMACALLGAVLTGCTAVEDEHASALTPVPAGGVVLQGRIVGPLGKPRAVTLVNNNEEDLAIGVTALPGTTYTTFNFGVVPVGSPYNVAIKASPFGRICTVSGGSGTITTAAALNIVVNCVNDPDVPRYDMRVRIPASFGTRAGAKITLTTDEGIYVMENPANSPADPNRVGTIAAGADSVTFNDVLFNNVVGGTVWGASSPGATAVASTANGGINPYTNIVGGVVNGSTFTWTVTATTTEESTPDRPQLNRCSVTAGSNALGSGAAFMGTSTGSPGTPNFTNQPMPPVGSIGFGTVASQIPTVGACSFTIGGNVSYSYPSGTTPPGTHPALPAGGLELQLKDLQGNVIETLAFNGNYAPNPASTAAGTGYTFATTKFSNPNSVYEVAVSRHPSGHRCVVSNGGQAMLGVPMNAVPANITNANVVCRTRPTGAANNAVLKGTYLFLNGETYNAPSPLPAFVAGNSVQATAADGTITTTTTLTQTVNTRTLYNSGFSATIPGDTPAAVGESWGQAILSSVNVRTVVTTASPGGSTTTISDSTLPGTANSNSNNPTRNMLTFFEDGTFIYGVHGSPGTSALNQIEHGFYLYDTTTSTIRFTLITDTNISNTTASVNVTLPTGPATATTFGVANGLAGAAVQSSSTLAAGLSGTGGAAAVNGFQTATMTSVVRSAMGTRAMLTGKFALVGGAGSVATFHGSEVTGSRWATWNMIEPRNTDGTMEGAFSTQDHRRVWVYDDNPKLGFHVGVNGGAANLQDACFTVADALAVTGIYARRSGISGCLGGISLVDIPQPRTSQTNPPVGTPVSVDSLPGWTGRIPGGGIVVDGRPPSPAYYAVGRADLLGVLVAANPEVVPYFPAEDITPAALAWCVNAAGTGPGEVYAVRTSLNGIPGNMPIYFCRHRAN